MPPRLLIGALLLVGSFAFFRWAMNRMPAEEKARSRSPFKEKLLRPAGESPRLRIEEIRVQIMGRGLVLATTSVMDKIAPPCIKFTGESPSPEEKISYFRKARG
jgi:hypothetical protein